jgi:transcriptional regulator with GAF, ATPase, and Fis domain
MPPSSPHEDPPGQAWDLRAPRDAIDSPARDIRSGGLPFIEHHSPDTIGIVGVSAAMRRCLRQAEAAAGTEAAVLLAGETGTGKDLFARFLHQRSLRRSGPFVAIECAALPEVLLESKLFGHERGAYTGADRRRVGRLETARGGTVLLNDVAELPLRLQGKLLRALETREFERLGSSTPRRANVRIVATTRRDLTATVRMGAFRQDLFARLAGCAIHLPPLRERPEDIGLLAHYFLGQLRPHVLRIDDASLAAAEDYPWPGNARELRNAIERAVILAKGPVLSLDLPAADRETDGVDPVPCGATDLAAQVRDLKVRAITQALAQTAGNRTQAARLLGLDPASLFRMARRLGLWPASRP